jgi:hypothetical protein
MTTNVTYKSIAPITLGCGNTHRYEVTMTDSTNGSSFCVHSTCERDVAENFKQAGMPVPAELEGPYDGYGHRIAVTCTKNRRIKMTKFCKSTAAGVITLKVDGHTVADFIGENGRQAYMAFCKGLKNDELYDSDFNRYVIATIDKM